MPNARDGDFYKSVEVFGRRFELYYGYYEDYERENGEPPIPIYPDFLRQPLYTEDGFPFVTQMQAPCEHHRGVHPDGFCADCPYYEDGEELIGICRCTARRREQPGQAPTGEIARERA